MAPSAPGRIARPPLTSLSNPGASQSLDRTCTMTCTRVSPLRRHRVQASDVHACSLENLWVWRSRLDFWEPEMQAFVSGLKQTVIAFARPTVDISGPGWAAQPLHMQSSPPYRALIAAFVDDCCHAQGRQAISASCLSAVLSFLVPGCSGSCQGMHTLEQRSWHLCLRCRNGCSSLRLQASSLYTASSCSVSA